MAYILNTWYMIAWAEEITQKPFSRTILDMPILVFRDPDGRPVALLDRCPHRFAPLSRGTVQGASIRCGYHGLEFNSSGQCVRNPFSNAIPAAAKVRSFPVVERDNVVWVWTGAEDRADAAKITRIAHHLDPAQRCVHGMTTAQADYRLLSDNLMDLTHVAFLHKGFFGGAAPWPTGSGTEEPDGSVLAEFVIERVPNFLDSAEVPGEFVRNHDRIRWTAPATHVLEGRASSLEDPNIAWVNHSAHILTPESAHTTHYFWSSAVPATAALTDAAHLALLHQTFDEEDKPMVEAVQQRMQGAELWDLNPVLLKNDTSAVRVRRRVTALLKAEAEQGGVGKPTAADITA